MGEQEIANVREASAMQQKRRALHEHIATAEALAKSREPALLEAIVRDVRAEIIEGVLATVLVGEHDLGPMRGVGGSAACVACLHRAVLGERAPAATDPTVPRGISTTSGTGPGGSRPAIT